MSRDYRKYNNLNEDPSNNIGQKELHLIISIPGSQISLVQNLRKK